MPAQRGEGGGRTTLPYHVKLDGSVSVLNAILLRPISLAIWRRPMDGALRKAVLRDALGEFSLLRLTARPSDLRELLLTGLGEAGCGPASIEALASDIAGLAHIFADLVGPETVDVRLERITGDACRKFHTDYVSARLITTYRGRGTQWLDQDSATELASGANVSCLPVGSLAEGDVAVLKGRLWDEDYAIVHRSPPITGTGEDRIVLVLNPGDFARDTAISN